MGRKTKKKRSKAIEEKVKPEPYTVSVEQPSSDEKPFDFGGLPDRDLKKNLGCG